MSSRSILSRPFIDPTIVPAAPARVDSSKYEELVAINAPVNCAVASTTVQDGYVHVAAKPSESAASTTATVNTDALVEPGQAIVSQKANLIITMLPGGKPQVKVSPFWLSAAWQDTNQNQAMNGKQCIVFIVNLYANMHPQPFAINAH
jgi:hypothetical protein